MTNIMRALTSSMKHYPTNTRACQSGPIMDPSKGGTFIGSRGNDALRNVKEELDKYKIDLK